MLALVLIDFGRAALIDLPGALMFIGAFLALIKKIDPVYILLVGAVLSVLIFGIFPIT